MSPIFKAKDGSEWPSAAEATARDELLAAGKAAQEAVKEYWKLAAATEKTADGKLFNRSQREYWEVRWGYDRPWLEEIRYLWSVEVEHGEYGVTLAVQVYDHHKQRHTDTRSVRISDLYASKKQALLRLGEEWRVFFGAELDRARRALSECPVALKSLEDRLAADLADKEGS